MKKIVTLFAALFSFVAVFAAPTITGVTAQQRYPWNGKVDISYTVNGDIAAHCNEYGLIPSLKVTATDKVASKTYTATKLSGDTKLTAGTHKIVWDMDAQGLSFKSANVVFNVACETTEAQYCVIDLSAGANATSYPVTYLASEPSGGFNVDTYKKTKLVLKRIAAGSFIMGEDQSDQSHKVTLTKPFYMGIFEVTQKQWKLVMNTSPFVNQGVGDTCPAYGVSYNSIRGSSLGSQWPTSADVDTSSFLGKLQSRSSLSFDLPTDAQWEYVRRAGTKTKYYWGDKVSDVYTYEWVADNAGQQVHSVGGKKSNQWGFFDMCGNVSEHVRDWSGAVEYGENPVGPTSGRERVRRGGYWYTMTTTFGAFIYRYAAAPDSDGRNMVGFRLSRTLP